MLRTRKPAHTCVHTPESDARAGARSANNEANNTSRRHATRALDPVPTQTNQTSRQHLGWTTRREIALSQLGHDVRRRGELFVAQLRVPVTKQQAILHAAKRNEKQTEHTP